MNNYSTKKQQQQQFTTLTRRFSANGGGNGEMESNQIHLPESTCTELSIIMLLWWCLCYRRMKNVEFSRAKRGTQQPTKNTQNQKNISRMCASQRLICNEEKCNCQKFNYCMFGEWLCVCVCSVLFASSLTLSFSSL